MARTPAVRVHKLTHTYGQRVALKDVSFEVWPGDAFGVLGPNGGGKTTLFRILSTLTSPQTGQVVVLGHALPEARAQLREKLGVLFQSPGLDKKLTVYENLKIHGRLYGLRGFDLEARITQALQWMGLGERSSELVETLSGGLVRRAELAKVMLHRPRLLVLDEPTTGLDPAARKTLWDHLQMMRQETGLTLLVTTHLLEEADRLSVLALLDRGSVVALDTPDTLKALVGGYVITIAAREPERLAPRIAEKFGGKATVVSGRIRLERTEGPTFVKQLMDSFGQEIEELSLGRPNLEDVFVRLTGHAFSSGEGA